jgi:hypothetical protein
MSGPTRWGLSLAIIAALSIATVQAAHAQQTNTTQSASGTGTGNGSQGDNSGGKGTQTGGATSDATNYRSGKHNVVVGSHHGY